MKQLIVLLLFLAVTPNLFADTAVTMPYGEFKTLYSEKLRREILSAAKQPPFIHTINNARYEITLSPAGALCRAVLSGSTISGSPEAIPLFSDKIIIRKIETVSGGSLISSSDKDCAISFFPSGDPSFSLALTFFVPTGEDNNSCYIDFTIPRALENALTADATADTVILGLPGVKSDSGICYFSPRSSLKIRFSHGAQARARAAKKQEDLSQKFEPVATPAVVLDAVNCFTTFEESGNSLSVISATLPPETGPTFAVGALPGAEIWQCRINGKKVKVYKNPTGDWIIPLARDKVSLLELALLSHGPRMGLHGRLDLTLPRLALPARRINMALGLPRRVEMVSFQGPVTPSRPFNTKAPKEFSGTPYYFSRSFHKGQPITLAISYKEPVRQSSRK